MATEATNMGMEAQDPVDTNAEKKKLKEERKRLKNERKVQKKEAKQRAKELDEQQANLEGDDVSGVSVFLVTLVIVIIWVAILCLLIKLDVGGFGSGVLKPILKDVPVVNKILPADSTVVLEDEEEAYGGYTSLRDAVDYIKELELQLEDAQSASSVDSEAIVELQAEIERLQTFEDAQVEFERIKTEFYEEVIYAENGPGAEEYQKYYQTMDPTTAEYLYKQVIQQEAVDKKVQDYAQAYSEMKPKEAAAIFEEMTDDLDLAAKILYQMSAEDRGKILGAMDTEIAARLTRIMDPE